MDTLKRFHKIAGEEGVGDNFTPTKRSIPKNHPYDPKALKPMARMLWAMSVSMGHALTAYREFTKLKSSTISPDGLLGGHGYVMPIKEVRTRLYEACEALSAISDTIHDEINAPHWKPRLAELNENDSEDFQKLMGESEKNLENPGEEVVEEIDEIEAANDAKWKAQGVESESEPASQTPGGGTYLEENVTFRPQKKEAKRANSSEPVEFIPGGPRVDHIDRCEGQGPFGSYNDDEPPSADDWAATEGVGNEYLYESEWSNDTSGRNASSNLPIDTTPTDANDFGLGYGRSGDGSEGYGVRAPDGRGVYGPASSLPDDPGGQTRAPESDTNDHINLHLAPTLNVWSSSVLPNDFEPPVARSDYYRGPKGNTISQAIEAESELPGDSSVTYNYDRDTPGAGATFEHTDNPYIKWDATMKNYRPDATFERRPER